MTKKSKNLNATRSPSFKRNQVSEAVTAAIVTSLLATSNTVAQEADGDNKDDEFDYEIASAAVAAVDNDNDNDDLCRRGGWTSLFPR